MTSHLADLVARCATRAARVGFYAVAVPAVIALSALWWAEEREE